MINSTTNYSIFKKHPNNVPIEEINLKKIVASIRKRNLLRFRPILVDKEMRIIDGQHRLEAAKELGVPIYYQVDENINAEDMIQLNLAGRNWKAIHFVDYYASQGIYDYIKLKDFARELGLNVREAYELFSGQGGMQEKEIRLGKFKIPEDEELKIIKESIQKYRKFIEFIASRRPDLKANFNSRYCKKAFIKICQLKSFDFDVFTKKLNYKFDILHPCAKITQFMTLFINIYNWKSRNILRLAQEESDVIKEF